MATVVLVTPALADYPDFANDSFRGSKGTYRINYTKRTYRGCLFSGGCINLGKKQLIPCNGSGDECEIIRWKRGEYEYSVHDRNVMVTQNGRVIFEDRGIASIK